MGIHARRALFAITVAAALALPVLVYFDLDAGSRDRGLELRLASLKRQTAQLPEYAEHVARYQKHLALLASFSKAAKQHGVGPENWDTHDVNIKDMFVSFSDLKGFIADMGPSHDSYFVPSSLDLKTQPTVTYEDIKAAAGRGKVSEGGVRLSLTGEFLVEH
ncbi:MAG: hypothetical protein WB783_07070 [Arenicellales bacterium]|jgi:hypothetical protein